MRGFIGRAFLMFPFATYWYRSGMSANVLVCAAFAYIVLMMWDGSRGIRCPVSYILAKMVFVSMIVFIPFFKLLFIPLGYVQDVGLWVGFYLSFGFVGMLLACQLVAQTIGHLFIYPKVDSNYHALRATGYHPIFDRGVFGFFNPDSDLIRHGGFEEPAYTNFVPPTHWQHQCPSCGARVEFDWGVCWNCNYGANGDATAYHKRYGFVDQPPKPSYDGTSPDDPEPPEEPGPYAPVQPRQH